MSPKSNHEDTETFSRQQMDNLAATLSIFDWLAANGFVSKELLQLKKQFMSDYGDEAQAWLDHSDPPPSWEQLSYLLRENQRLQTQVTELQAQLQERK